MPTPGFDKKCEEAVKALKDINRVAEFLAETCDDVNAIMHGVGEGRRHGDDFHIVLQLALLQCALETAKKTYEIEDAVDCNAFRLMDSVRDYLES